MVDRCFGLCVDWMVSILEGEVGVGGVGGVNMESWFSKTAFDIIGIFVFNYDFEVFMMVVLVI